MAMYVLYRQHCRLSICEYWLGWTNTVSIRTKDPNNHSDTETGTLSMYVHWLVFHLVLPTEMDSETGRLGGV